MTSHLKLSETNIGPKGSEIIICPQACSCIVTVSPAVPEQATAAQEVITNAVQIVFFWPHATPFPARLVQPPNTSTLCHILSLGIMVYHSLKCSTFCLHTGGTNHHDPLIGRLLLIHIAPSQLGINSLRGGGSSLVFVGGSCEVLVRKTVEEILIPD